MNKSMPAFPTPTFYEEEQVGVDDGMTLRDYFASHALMGLMANSDLPDLFAKGFAPSKAAEIVYEVADAMLVQRLKK